MFCRVGDEEYMYWLAAGAEQPLSPPYSLPFAANIKVSRAEALTSAPKPIGGMTWHPQGVLGRR